MKSFVVFFILFAVAFSQNDDNELDDGASVNVEEELQSRFSGYPCFCVTDPCFCYPKFGRSRNKNCVCVTDPCECDMFG
ncbi:hypothetical protein PVAND_003076 [Polypedilum vanderplanki]|uniref:Uncharacterized protein n=1 Tax=Polypedilum vanderplanki TaxID=319348 RepID=A0A9J6BU15_POLVA|nr:hypothetical protein PVAND_003076 [Polypedilum vanderplanki]